MKQKRDTDAEALTRYRAQIQERRHHQELNEIRKARIRAKQEAWAEHIKKVNPRKKRPIEQPIPNAQGLPARINPANYD